MVAQLSSLILQSDWLLWRSHVRILVTVYTSRLWLGATDRDVESVFRWTDGSLINYVNWDDGQPTGTANSNLNCLGLSPSTMKWTDYECTDNKQFLCETIQGRSKKCEICDIQTHTPRLQLTEVAMGSVICLGQNHTLDIFLLVTSGVTPTDLLMTN